MKTLEQVKTELRRRGETVTGWALKHGFKADDVRAVIYGRSKWSWGESHKIAVTLGLKEGEIVD
jgi:gp16 family phage-associated protein